MNRVHPDDARPGSWEWTVCGASVTGSQHLSRGLGCDDAFGYGMVGDFVVAAVADGAGSVTGTSAWGSYAACQSVLNAAMRTKFIGDFHNATSEDAHDVMRWLFDGALIAVTAEAAQMGLSVAQLATTLCVAVARPGLAVFGQIGDGVIAAEDGGEISTILIEDKDDYANETWFLQSKEAFDQSFRVDARSDLGAFALSTDGMTYKITNIVTGEAFEPFFNSAWENVRSGGGSADFAAMLRGIKDDQTGDDKTMVLAALRWQEDLFHPSARPVQTTVIGSAAPPVIASASPAGSLEKNKHSQPIIADGRVVDVLDSGVDGADERPASVEHEPRTSRGRERRRPVERERRGSPEPASARGAEEPRGARHRYAEPDSHGNGNGNGNAPTPKRRWRTRSAEK